MAGIARKYVRWNWDWNLDAALRYDEAARLIREKRPESLVEVGSGSRGISRYTGWPSYAVDMTFESDVPPRAERRIRASGAALPFANGFADMVVCTDVLEHVAPAQRSDVISEMFRVLRGDGLFYVAFPSGPDSHEADKAINDAHIQRKGRPHPWLGEHVAFGLPDIGDVLPLVEREAAARGWRVSARRNTPLRLWLRYHRFFTVERPLPFTRHFHRVLTQPLFGLFRNIDPDPAYRASIVASPGC